MTAGSPRSQWGVPSRVADVTDALVLVRTTIATLASQTSFTLTAGSTDDDAYNGLTAVVIDASTAHQKCVGLISDYTGATKTITLASDPAVFTMAIGDDILIVASAPSSADLAAILVDTGTTLPATLGTPADTDLATDIANVYSRQGAPAGASQSADIAAVKVDTAAILVDSAALDAVKTQTSNANTTALSDAGVTPLLTVSGADIWVTGACLVSNGATTANLTSAPAAVLNAAGDTALHTIIDATNAAQSALDAAGKRAVASVAAAAEGLPVLVQVGEHIGLTLSGGGSTAVDLDLNIEWHGTAAASAVGAYTP